ncbi:MAG: VWA-like domain-containing protein [Coriobacteriia bacterium]
MADELEQQARADQLARDILGLARDTLLVNMRFLDIALGRFRLAAEDTGRIATDGERLAYDARHVLRTYRVERETIVRDYLHLVFHCILHHPFVSRAVNRPCWDLATDIAVENAINDLSLRAVANSRPAKQAPFLQELQEEIGQLTAERIYRHFLDLHLGDEQLAEVRRLFLGDDHGLWYVQPESDKGAEKERKADQENPPDSPGDQESEQEEAGDQSDSSAGDKSGARRSISRDELEKEWKQVSERVQVDLDTASKGWGQKAGALVQGLNVLTREKHDYGEFLRRFAILDEAVRINNDEFDYVFYTYGLDLYGNMPLIEPLEYKDVKRIREFVIAIDTSGSVSGELVQKFIQKTYNILKQTDNFFTKSNLHIIQADAAVQEDVKITSAEQLDEFLSAMEPKGLGGTDFRPVFEYVDELRQNKEFTDLRGLIYFTDGYGTFPTSQPAYDTAFVFIDDGAPVPDVPVWAIKLVLTEDEI